MRGWRAAFAISVATLAFPGAARADERILRFVSDVAVRPDATLDVSETIDVRSENVRVNHGIYRDFPTRYRGPHGTPVRVGFKLGQVTRDGKPEPAATEPVSNGVRIRIGSADVTVPEGEHRYVIHYETTRQIGRFAGYDELYWNATGNGWLFPIDTAEARIRLPAAVRFGQHAVYTGFEGSTERNAELIEDRAGEIAFRTTRPLGPYEGLTVAAAFPKGVVAEESRTRWWLSDYGPIAVGALGLLGLLAFYFVAWKRAGRDPRPGTVVPLFAPSDDLSPAAMRYVWKMGADNRAFAAALVDLGVKGHVRMVEEDGGFFKRDKVRLERLTSTTPLSAPETSMLETLVEPGGSIVMEQANHTKFSAAKKLLNDSFARNYEGKLFRRNWGWAIAGLAVFAGALWLTAAAVVAASGAEDGAKVALPFAALVPVAILMLLIHRFQTVGKCLVVVGAFLFGALALATGFPIVAAAFATGWWAPLLLPLMGIAVVVSAFFWIAAPTAEGRGVLDRIAGFRQYLSIAEGERLDRMTALEDTPELFERYLPYAIALGVENRWADRFQGVLAAAAAQGQQGMAWYSGSRDPWRDPGGFADTVGSSLASTISSASTAPGSSSGSGGGGSSGGGGGGGGGGGW